MSTVAEPGTGQTLRAALIAVERHTGVALAPAGDVVAFVRTSGSGPAVWSRTLDGRERLLADCRDHLVAGLRWAPDGSAVVYRKTLRGHERWSLATVDCATGSEVVRSAAAPINEFWLAAEHPGTVVFSSGDGLWRAELRAASTAAEPLAEGLGFHRWLVDRALRARGGVRLAADGSLRLAVGDDPSNAEDVLVVSADDAADFAVLGFTADGRTLHVLSGADAPTRRLLAVDLATGTTTTVFAHASLDLDVYPIVNPQVCLDPETGAPDLCSVISQRIEYLPLSPQARRFAEVLAPRKDESPILVERSAGDRAWLVVDVRTDAPLEYRVVDPRTGSSTPVLLNRPELAGRRLPRLEDLAVVARDGSRLTGYLIRPRRRGPLPTVVLVHGGPNDRDWWRFHAEAQLLADLGYLSLHVNYRGSRGFGRAFRLAGHGEWGGRMQDDLDDAVSWAIDAGLADAGRIAFFGASYGGYAALFAACARRARCAIAISPPCDLVSFVREPPPYWRPLWAALERQILVSEAGPLDDATLRRRSPMHMVGPGCAPMLVAHGVRDPRVPVSSLDAFVERAHATGVDVDYLRFEDEGHLIKSNRNRTRLFTATEHFLEAQL